MCIACALHRASPHRSCGAASDTVMRSSRGIGRRRCSRAGLAVRSRPDAEAGVGGGLEVDCSVPSELVHAQQVTQRRGVLRHAEGRVACRANIMVERLA